MTRSDRKRYTATRAIGHHRLSNTPAHRGLWRISLRTPSRHLFADACIGLCLDQSCCYRWCCPSHPMTLLTCRIGDSDQSKRGHRRRLGGGAGIEPAASWGWIQPPRVALFGSNDSGLRQFRRTGLHNLNVLKWTAKFDSINVHASHTGLSASHSVTIHISASLHQYWLRASIYLCKAQVISSVPPTASSQPTGYIDLRPR